MNLLKLVSQVQSNLSEDLLKEGRGQGDHPHSGHCYVASEALYHLLGGKDEGLTPARVSHEGTTHWFLRMPGGFVLDATAEQFSEPVPYRKARGSGFLTKEPSKRTRKLLNRLPDRK